MGQPESSRKGLMQVAHIHADAASALDHISRELAAIAAKLRELNPRANLRLHALRRKQGTLASSSAMREFLADKCRQKRQTTSALRLRLNDCGSATCSGCPHPHWSVWRLYRDHETGRERQYSSELRTSQQVHAFARHAAPGTLALVKRAQALIVQRASLVAAFATLGKVARASLSKTHASAEEQGG